MSLSRSVSQPVAKPVATSLTGAFVGPAFDPLADADLVGLWLALNATDNGTTLTLPDSTANGFDLTSTGVGRPVIDATGFAGNKAINSASSTVVLSSSAIGAALATKTAVSVVMLIGNDSVPQTTAFCMKYGTGGAGDFQFATKYVSEGQIGALVALSPTSEDARTTALSERLIYPKVIATTINLAASSSQVTAIYQNGKTIPFARSTSGTVASSLANTTLYVGSRHDAAFPFAGRIAGMAIASRVLTQAEVQQYTTWFLSQYSMGTPRQFLWVGDSITAETDGYRYWLQQKYEADRGTAVDWGTYETIGDNGAGATFNQNWHNGVSGSTVSDAQTRLTTLLGTGVYKPDIIGILSGVNDIILNGRTGAQVAADWTSLLIAVYDAMPTAKIKLLSLIKNTSAGGVYTSVVVDANNLGPTAVANAIASRPGMQAEWITNAYDVTLADGTHPTTGTNGGYNQIADVLWPIVKTW